MRRDEPQFFDVFAQQPEPVEEPHSLRGLAAAVVSRDERTGAATLLVRFPAGFRGGEAAEAGTLECFVLEGELALEGERAAGGGFLSVPRGSGGAELAAPAGAAALVFWSPSLPVGHGSRRAVRSAWEVPWEITVLEGFPHGFMHKSLRQPDISTERAHGAEGGFLRLVLPAAGWFSPRQERHPGCWEENIMLRGDLLMPGRGLMRPGICLANPADHWHGPMASKGGGLLLVHCDAPMAVDYRDDGREEELRRYLETAPWA